jgi:hypothetical protein
MLVGHNNLLYYFGNDLDDDDPLRSIVFDMDHFYLGLGVTRCATNFSFHSVPVLSNTGSGIPGVGTPWLIHFSVDEGGFSGPGFNEGTGGGGFEDLVPVGVPLRFGRTISWADSTSGGQALPFNERFNLVFTFSESEMSVSALGKTTVFRHPQSKETLNFTGQPADGNTVRLGLITYTFKDTLTGAANEVKINATTLATTITNLKAAVEASAGAGTLYGTGTVQNALVSAGGETTTSLGFRSVYSGPVGDAIIATKVGANMSFVGGSGLLYGGARTPLAQTGPIKSWWVEHLKNTINATGYARFHRIIANSPNPGDFMVSSVLLARLLASGTARYPNKMHFMNGAADWPANQAPPGNESVGFNGNTHVAGHYQAVSWAGFGTRKMVQSYIGSTVEFTSVTTQTLATNWFDLGAVPFQTDGDFHHVIVKGNFPNGNNKEIAIDVTGSQVWTTGTLADTGGWEMSVIRHRRTSSKTNQIHIKFTTGSRTLFGYADLSGDNPARVRCLAPTANGDVRVYCVTGYVSPR